MPTRPASACSSLADPGCRAVRGDHRSSKKLYVRLIFTTFEIHNCSRLITYSHIYTLYIIYCIIYSPYVRFFPKLGDSKKQQSNTQMCCCVNSGPGRDLPGDGLEYALALRSAAVYVLGICSVPLLFPCRSAPEVPVPKSRGGDVGFNGLVENDENSGDMMI